ncbi:uncharacterized protein V6R79_014748 [Siganus canaliculatus]
MANRCLQPVQFTGVKDTGFYFKDVEEDRFAKSSLSVLRCPISDREGALLVLDAELHLLGREMNTDDEAKNKFNIMFYMDDKQMQKGRPVILYAIKDGKKMLVCCNDNREIHPVAKDPPEEIPGDVDKAVFYMTDVTTSTFMFESSFFRSNYLAFEHDESNSEKKLVLLEKDRKKVVECVQFYLDDSSFFT